MLEMYSWNYIRDTQPIDGKVIIQVDRAFQGHHTMGMVTYNNRMPIDELIEFNKKSGWPLPDFWWIYADEFPFPPDSKNEEN